MSLCVDDARATLDNMDALKMDLGQLEVESARLSAQEANLLARQQYHEKELAAAAEELGRVYVRMNWLDNQAPIAALKQARAAGVSGCRRRGCHYLEFHEFAYDEIDHLTVHISAIGRFAHYCCERCQLQDQPKKKPHGLRCARICCDTLERDPDFPEYPPEVEEQ